MHYVVLALLGTILLGCTTRTVPIAKGQLQPSDTGYYRHYEIKGNHVFYRGNIITGADVLTFEYIAFAFSKDKNAVYFGEKKLSKANPNTFSEIEYPYFRDRQHVFYIPDTIEYILTDADPNTFQVLSPAYAKDKRHVYTTIESELPTEIHSADAPSFRTHANGIYYSDTNYLYDVKGTQLISRDTLDIYNDERSPLHPGSPVGCIL